MFTKLPITLQTYKILEIEVEVVCLKVLLLNIT